jgi:hypothetical protein
VAAASKGVHKGSVRDGDRSGSVFDIRIERIHSSGAENGPLSQGYNSRGTERERTGTGQTSGTSGRPTSSPSLPLSIDTQTLVPVQAQISVHASSASITTSGEPIALSSPVLRVKPKTLHLMTTDLYNTEAQSEADKAAAAAALKGAQLHNHPLTAWHSPSLRSSPTGKCCDHYTLRYCRAEQCRVACSAQPHPLPVALTGVISTAATCKIQHTCDR